MNKIFKNDLTTMTNEQIYMELVKTCSELIETNSKKIEGDRKVYYISSEFLIGKLLSNNLINLKIYDQVKEELSEAGIAISDIEELESEPSLGNGGLGRLAACFVDSLSTLNLNGEGVGLLYHFGLFKQEIESLKQKAVPNPWIDDKSILNETDIEFEVEYPNFTAKSKLYNIPVLGFNGGYNNLRLFDITTVDETIVNSGIDFDKEDIQKNLTLFLYPDDSDRKGELLRIYQQYFMVSNAVQLIFQEEIGKGHDLKDLAKHVTIQINDTHPTLVIPELIYQLGKVGIETEEAIEIASKVCAYTNHTILAEALEKWDRSFLDEVVPHLMPIIERLNDIVNDKFDDEKLAIIDKDGRVHMAHLCIHFTYSTNGVAALHTDILKESELNHFYQVYPERFNSKTNGITFRRWLMKANPELKSFLDETIGTEYHHFADKLEGLLEYKDNQDVLAKLDEIKQVRKNDLAEYIEKREGIKVNPNSIFDIQIKRLHEYKRQQMNMLYVIYKIHEIRKGNLPETPITMIFGGKAAPAYTIAQDIIHAISTLQSIIANDDLLKQHLNVIFVQNYNVTYAEYLFPAADISEQISLASKEASGTGNMKFMLNGAVTLGTSDGANVEIADLVGPDNVYTFGRSSDEIIKLYEDAGYNSKEYYDHDAIKYLVDYLVGEEMTTVGDSENLTRLYNEILNKDWFMTLIDLEEYIEIKERMFADYTDRDKWLKMSLVNIAKAGYFSSDRTIDDYAREVWKLGK
ncbi:glycogen/starch/alpha-glucan phosphorylase [Mollicutes bacterium LVI A0078]|nr:glycogen/starch/alpha-glucan phosphorylase [Mollicutes bacterium LVI A0075]WOO90366.1 glycogen/starch/alpha-glucan phosphorylase [Mollicutes bacterium LVI A0078]